MALELSATNKLFDAADMSADATSKALDLAGVIGLSVLVKSASNTRAGTIYFEMVNGESDSDWITVSSKTVVVSTALLHLEDMSFKNGQYLRVRWAKDGGSMAGSLTAIVHLKHGK